ncbi:2-oxoacid:acceptor oxidoreductase subunit alpha [Methanoregula sp. UBA64]|jgi:2-oxoglutarate/2-oxoacid ferredoxin oxidoreductase subunit alpha|uniref:2-oxoacid:acceptor oxidoreductase subunit alpha n=1 Tax=Methanoregula sp. UBA64 TaxID=1915554 RepID=UPI0025F9AAD5|nr:2-oxoacid:acceptor oxidoreductase subunit alpha [Methanoregula sp. UBA64]
MKDISVLIGGRAGDGINSAGAVVAWLFSRLGYYVFVSTDYPSLIRGGHNFTMVRAADHPVGAYNDRFDYLVALNQETLDLHAPHCPDCIIVANADQVKKPGSGQTISVGEILKEESAPPVTGNSAMIGAFAKAAGIPWKTLEEVFTAHMPKAADENLRVARRAYGAVNTVRPVPVLGKAPLSLITGNEAIGLGLASGGLDSYIAYPMTPSSTLLHYLAGNAERLGITVFHPESEIAVILAGIGSAVAGKKTAVGTSGGGFCLMTEGLSFAGMAEVPLAILVSQRTGPSTGLPTYTGQADLRFVLHAGQGEFPRIVVAPADAGEAYVWSDAALRLAWKYQVPSIVLSDKSLSESTYSLRYEDLALLSIGERGTAGDNDVPYRRYRTTLSGVSPLAFPGTTGAVVKTNSYAHDEDGITTEDAALVAEMADKRRRKETALIEELAHLPCVSTGGKTDAPVALLCWGSVGNACSEVAAELGLRVIRPLVLSPFPDRQFTDACTGVERLIAVEENATGQLASLVKEHGGRADATVLKYDGRPFTPEELKLRVQEVLAS